MVKTPIGKKKVNLVKCTNKSCGEVMKSTKTENIQCGKCGTRFDLKEGLVKI